MPLNPKSNVDFLLKYTKGLNKEEISRICDEIRITEDSGRLSELRTELFRSQIPWIIRLTQKMFVRYGKYTNDDFDDFLERAIFDAMDAIATYDKEAGSLTNWILVKVWRAAQNYAISLKGKKTISLDLLGIQYPDNIDMAEVIFDKIKDKEQRKLLVDALNNDIEKIGLGDVEIRRFKKYISGITITDIGIEEDVSPQSVRESIERAIEKLRKYFTKSKK